uniref:ANK_REP_REGION domain-containing protein n=1 Tax=Anopheles maculatus TaxID=74869 RepID=A0A182SFQ8_9DIPT
MMTPPTHHDGDVRDVDVRGPCGMTPLMVAAVRGGGLDSGEDIDSTDDSAAQIISELVAQGAELNATMDKTGETSLHLAARYARADAAKRLLDAGAEANSQDNTGRTPLHAAVAADAMGVFQILLRNRATNLNARMHDGTTPLILAARLAIEGMVEDLIQADADINAADNSGKTALHWASAVNNVDAVNILLSHGANRDAQDDKDETPLFLAAREGSFEACRALLDNFANRDITDHMDRLPRDVASERLHHDIVRLLDEHVPRSPQMVTTIPSGNGGSTASGAGNTIMSPTHAHMITHPTIIASAKQSKQKKQRQQKMNVGGVAGSSAAAAVAAAAAQAAVVVANMGGGVGGLTLSQNPTSPQDGGADLVAGSMRRKAVAKKSGNGAASKKTTNTG